MNEQRTFTVTVTSCRACPYAHKPLEFCRLADLQKRGTAYEQNLYDITPSCPMWKEAKPIEQLLKE